MLKKVARKIRKIKYKEEKLRFLLFAFILISSLGLATFLLNKVYSKYETKSILTADIDRALYIFDEDKMSFNLDPNKIVPSDDPLIYKFSISNFNESKQSDVNISYNLNLRTTTNLPLTLELYRNEVYMDNGTTNLLGGALTKQDEDGAWYRTYTLNDEYEMKYTDKVTDIYTLVIHFPKIYSQDTTYINNIDNIEININSKQII